MTHGFRITRGSGFQVTFANGWTVSVQFSSFNYCANHNIASAEPSCVNAETAVLDPQRNFFPIEGDEVQPNQTPEQVTALLTLISTKDPLP